MKASIHHSLNRQPDNLILEHIYTILQLDAKLPDYSREGDVEYPFEEIGGIGDENRFPEIKVNNVFLSI